MFRVVGLITLLLLPAADPIRREPIPGVDGPYILHSQDPEAGVDWGELVGEPGEDDLLILRRARLAAATEAVKAYEVHFELGGVGGEEFFGSGYDDALRLLLEARLEAAENDAERLAAWEEYLPHVRSHEQLVLARQLNALQGGTTAMAARSRAERMAAEIEVLKLRRQVHRKQ